MLDAPLERRSQNWNIEGVFLWRYQWLQYDNSTKRTGPMCASFDEIYHVISNLFYLWRIYAT